MVNATRGCNVCDVNTDNSLPSTSELFNDGEKVLFCLVLSPKYCCKQASD